MYKLPCISCKRSFKIWYTREKHQPKNKKNAEEAGKTYHRKVILSTPQNSPIVNSLNRASVKENESLHKLFEVAYLIAKKEDHLQTIMT